MSRSEIKWSDIFSASVPLNHNKVCRKCNERALETAREARADCPSYRSTKSIRPLNPFGNVKFCQAWNDYLEHMKNNLAGKAKVQDTVEFKDVELIYERCLIGKF